MHNDTSRILSTNIDYVLGFRATLTLSSVDWTAVAANTLRDLPRILQSRNSIHSRRSSLTMLGPPALPTRVVSPRWSPGSARRTTIPIVAIACVLSQSDWAAPSSRVRKSQQVMQVGEQFAKLNAQFCSS